MELRHSAMPDPPPRPAETPQPEVSGPPPTELSFRVDRRLTAVKVAGAVLFLLLAGYFELSGGDPARVVFAVLGALVLGGYAARDMVAPVRLAADADGVTVVSGFAGQRRLPWAAVERIRVDRRNRLGTRSELLEIDAGETLHLFSGYDLGMPCWEAAQALDAVNPRVRETADPTGQPETGPGR
jgi:hypothetical protein